MDQKEKVSIIIPLYNGKDFIDKTLSIIHQIKARKEIIVINDGSTDESGEHCIQLKEKYPELRVFHKKNGGIFTARNMGISLCTGDYVIFVDQDDYINPDNADFAIEYARQKRLDVLFWSCSLDFEGKMSKCDHVYSDCVVSKKEEIDTKLIQPLLLREQSEFTSYLGHVWAGLYSTELIKKYNIQFKRFISYEDDQLFVYDFLLRAQTVGFITNVVYYWVNNPSSFSRTKRKIDNIVNKYEDYFRYLSEQYRKNAHRPDEHYLRELETFGLQYTFCEAVRNAGFALAINGEAFSELKEIDRIDGELNYLRAIRKTAKHIHLWKNWIILFLSRLRMTKLAIWLTEKYFKYLVARN